MIIRVAPIEKIGNNYPKYPSGYKSLKRVTKGDKTFTEVLKRCMEGEKCQN